MAHFRRTKQVEILGKAMDITVTSRKILESIPVLWALEASSLEVKHCDDVWCKMHMYRCSLYIIACCLSIFILSVINYKYIYIAVSDFVDYLMFQKQWGIFGAICHCQIKQICLAKYSDLLEHLILHKVQKSSNPLFGVPLSEHYAIVRLLFMMKKTVHYSPGPFIWTIQNHQ